MYYSLTNLYVTEFKTKMTTNIEKAQFILFRQTEGFRAWYDHDWSQINVPIYICMFDDNNALCNNCKNHFLVVNSRQLFNHFYSVANRVPPRLQTLIVMTLLSLWEFIPHHQSPGSDIMTITWLSHQNVCNICHDNIMTVSWAPYTYMILG